MRVRFVMLRAAALAMCGVVSCGPRAHSGAERALDYAYSPASFHVHSLSRFAAEGDGSAVAIELWIEFLDIEGVTSRGVGMLQASVAIPGRNPVVCALDLDDAAANSHAWDRPLRMYRMVVPLKPPLEGDAPRAGVDVTWVRPTGVRSVVHTRIPSPGG